MNVQPDGTKICSRCREKKIASEETFYRAKQNDGWGAYCIPCVKAKVVEWQKANPERKAAADARHYKGNPERRRKTRERLDRWARENPEKAKQIAKEGLERYLRRHPERRQKTQARANRSAKGRARQRRWKAKPASIVMHRERERVRRAMLKHLPINVALRLGVPLQRFTYADWRAVLYEFGWCCAYCGKPKRMSMDHLEPVIRAGAAAAHVRGNIVPACVSCNSSKKDRTLEIFCARRGLDPAAIRARSAAPFCSRSICAAA